MYAHKAKFSGTALSVGAFDMKLKLLSKFNACGDKFIYKRCNEINSFKAYVKFSSVLFETGIIFVRKSLFAFRNVPKVFRKLTAQF